MWSCGFRPSWTTIGHIANPTFVSGWPLLLATRLPNNRSSWWYVHLLWWLGWYVSGPDTYLFALTNKGTLNVVEQRNKTTAAFKVSASSCIISSNVKAADISPCVCFEFHHQCTAVKFSLACWHLHLVLYPTFENPTKICIRVECTGGFMQNTHTHTQSHSETAQWVAESCFNTSA